MGDSSGSMLYAVAGFLILYFAGVIIFKIYDIMSAMWTLYLRMQISAPAAESLALNSVGDSYSRSGYDIIKKLIGRHLKRQQKS